MIDSSFQIRRGITLRNAYLFLVQRIFPGSMLWRSGKGETDSLNPCHRIKSFPTVSEFWASIWTDSRQMPFVSSGSAGLSSWIINGSMARVLSNDLPSRKFIASIYNLVCAARVSIFFLRFTAKSRASSDHSSNDFAAAPALADVQSHREQASAGVP